MFNQCETTLSECRERPGIWDAPICSGWASSEMIFSERLRVTNHSECAHSWYRIAFDAPHFAAEAVPGQFFMVETGSGADPFLRRPMSLHRFVRDENGNPTGFDLLYKVVGRGTELLSKVRVGETVGVFGPLGHGFSVVETASRHCLVVGGTGVAPMAALAEKLVLSGIKPTVLYGARTGAQIVCKQDFELLGADLALFTDDGSLGVKGMVTEGLDELPAAAPDKERSGTAIYACGPHDMLAAVAGFAHRAGIPCQVSLEARMGCGLGACMSCAVRAAETGPGGESRYLRVCLQGPVVDSRRVSWETET